MLLIIVLIQNNYFNIIIYIISLLPKFNKLIISLNCSLYSSYHNQNNPK